MNKKSLGVILAFLGIFIAGGVVGGLLALRFVRPDGPPRIPPEQFALQIMKRTTGQLDLTSEQKEKIFPLVTKTAVDLHRLRRDTITTTTTILDTLHKQVAEILTPAQRERFKQLLIEREAERARRFPNDRGPDRRRPDKDKDGQPLPPPPPGETR